MFRNRKSVMCVTLDQIKHAHIQVMAKEHQTDWTSNRGDFSMKKSLLANVMFGIGAIIATSLQTITIGAFFIGLGLISLHAFGLISPPL